MMRQVLALLVSILVQSPVADGQVITYPVCRTDTLTMEFNYATTQQLPYDLFATSRRSTCGKRAGTTTGSGTYADPYVISVDLSGGLATQSPDCGVFQTSPGTYSLTVSAVFSCEGPTTNDTDYTIDCNLNLPSSSSSTGTAVTSRSANYTCQAPSTILFTYSQVSQGAPFDIYAKGKESTCSRSANEGTGSGVDTDPYVLQIDTSNTANICGLTLTGSDTYSVTMYVQQVRDLITSSDVSYSLTCNFTALANQLISSASLPASSNVSVSAAYQNQPTASLYVVSSTSPDAVLSSFAVGDLIRLSARLLNGPATGLRIRQCTASPGPGLSPQLSILDDQGCSTGNKIVPPFIGQSPSGAQALTDSFEAFKFTGYDTVFFQCVADFCYGASDLTCLGTHCTSKGRRKRDAEDETVSDVITAYIMVRSDVSGNLTGITVKRPPQSNHPAVSSRKYTVVVASLASVCAVAVLVAILLAVKLIVLTSRKSRVSGVKDSQ